MKLNIAKSSFEKVSEINVPDIFYRRIKSGIPEFDNLFGDGILPGSSMTFTGTAGIGKTTALLQLAEALATNGYDVAYASGEENKHQIAFTCRRLGVKNIAVANETDIDTLAAAMKSFDLIIVDSFQALTSEKRMNSAELEKYAVTTLISAAKENECALIFVAHLTKAGVIKGSTLINHAVDVNFKLTMDEDSEETARVISVYKNRFGTTGDYHATMTSKGLEVSGKKEVVRAVSKTARKASLVKKVLEMDPPNITRQRIMKDLNLSSSQAYTLLREMVDSGKLVKMGRGDSAVFKKTLQPK